MSIFFQKWWIIPIIIYVIRYLTIIRLRYDPTSQCGWYSMC